MKFVIVSCQQCGGGPIVLHELCKLLEEQGCEAKIHRPIYPASIKSRASVIFYWMKCTLKDVIKAFVTNVFGMSHHGYEPVKGCKRKWLPAVDDDTIVIYPEVIYGNPLRAKKVVRWLLYHNRYPDDPEAYGKEDLFFAYTKLFNDYGLNPESRKLHVSCFDLDMYKRTNYGEREGTCYIIRKGSDRGDLPASFDGVIIDHLPEREKVRVFNQCKRCISYDTQTAYSTIAALCGCQSIVIPEIGKGRMDYQTADARRDGVAFGFDADELKYAESTRNKILENTRRVESQNAENVINFIKDCREYFKIV